ncbi:MAG: diguanylate cyclase [Parasphingorhabdus sp.]
MSEDETIWVCGPDIGVWNLVGETWSKISSNELGSIGKIRTLAKAPHNMCLVGGDRGVALIGGDGKVHASVNTPAPVTALLFVNQNIWASCNLQIIRFETTFDDLVAMDTILPETKVRHLNADKFGNVWAATDDHGIAKVSSLRNALCELETARLGSILSIRDTQNGRLIAGAKGLQWGDCAVMMEGQKIWDSWRSNDGVIYAAAESGLHHIVNPGLPLPCHHELEVLAAPCRVLHHCGDALYVGSIRGLAKVSHNGAEEILKVGGQSLGYVYSIFEDAESRIWIATFGAGLWYLEDDTIKQIASDDIGTSSNISSICQSRDGTIFIAHDNSISTMAADGRINQFVETNRSVAAWSITCTEDGSIVAGTSSGMIQYDAQSGEIIREIGSSTDENGLEFTTSRSLTFGDNGQLLCGTGSGLFSIDLEVLKQITTAPKPLLSSANWSGVEPDLIDEEIIVNEGRWRLQVNVCTDWMIDEADCKMSYRLLGFDKNWSPSAVLGEIVYSSLPPGRYALEVELRSPIAGTGPRIWVYEFRVRSKMTATLKHVLRISGKTRLAKPWSALGLKNLSRKNHKIEQAIRDRTLELRVLNDNLRKAHDRFELEAHTDPLTGIPNRRAFEAAIKMALNEAKTGHSGFSLLIIDIDHFKAYNDRYGHAQGDESLKQVASALNAELSDRRQMIARIGGEEFAILLSGALQKEAAFVAERLVQTVRNLNIAHDQSQTASYLTISAGSKTVNPGEAISNGAVMVAADAELYRAKNEGRNMWSMDDG